MKRFRNFGIFVLMIVLMLDVFIGQPITMTSFALTDGLPQELQDVLNGINEWIMNTFNIQETSIDTMLVIVTIVLAVIFIAVFVVLIVLIAKILGVGKLTKEEKRKSKALKKAQKKAEKDKKKGILVDEFVVDDEFIVAEEQAPVVDEPIAEEQAQEDSVIEAVEEPVEVEAVEEITNDELDIPDELLVSATEVQEEIVQEEPAPDILELNPLQDELLLEDVQEEPVLGDIDNADLVDLSDFGDGEVVDDSPVTYDNNIIIPDGTSDEVAALMKKIKTTKQVEEEESTQLINKKIFGGKKIYIDRDSIILPKCFESYLRQSDDSVKWVYDELKNELLSYQDVHSRVITGFEVFRRGCAQARMTIKGKTLYLYLRIDPNSVDQSVVKVKDYSHRKALEETPTEIRVSGKKKVNRCRELIADMFAAQGIVKRKSFEPEKYSDDFEYIEKGVIYSQNLVYKD